MTVMGPGTTISAWRAVRSRPWLAGAILLCSQAVALACWLALPHQYKSQAVLLLDTADAPGLLSQRDDKTKMLMAKITLLASPLLADEVVRTTGMDRSSHLRQMWADMDTNGLSFEEWLQRVVLSGIVPSGSPTSAVLKVGYVSSSPEMAQTLANAVAAALISTSAALNRSADRFAESAYGTGVERALVEFRAAQEALRQRSGVEMMDYKLADSALSDFTLSSRRTGALVQSYLQGVAGQQSLVQMGDTGSLLDDKFVQEQREELVVLKGQRAEVLTSMGDGNPVLKGLDASIRAVSKVIETRERQALMASAVGVKSMADTVAKLTRQDEARRSQLLARERSRLLADSAREAADKAGERFEDTMVMAEAATMSREVPQTELVWMSPANLPGTPWFPDISYYLPISLGLGLLMAVTGASFVERSDRRVRGESDLTEILGDTWIGRLS
jgi:uncharacterized protein involved in exopolysaccharide biosynthesis